MNTVSLLFCYLTYAAVWNGIFLIRSLVVDTSPEKTRAKAFVRHLLKSKLLDFQMTALLFVHER